MSEVSRRNFLLGTAAVIAAAPAVAKAAAAPSPYYFGIDYGRGDKAVFWNISPGGGFIYSDEIASVLRKQTTPMTRYIGLVDISNRSIEDCIKERLGDV